MFPLASSLPPPSRLPATTCAVVVVVVRSSAIFITTLRAPLFHIGTVARSGDSKTFFQHQSETRDFNNFPKNFMILSLSYRIVQAVLNSVLLVLRSMLGSLSDNISPYRLTQFRFGRAASETGSYLDPRSVIKTRYPARES